MTEMSEFLTKILKQPWSTASVSNYEHTWHKTIKKNSNGTGSLSKDINEIKENQIEILELENITSEMKNLSGWIPEQNGVDWGKNQWAGREDNRNHQIWPIEKKQTGKIKEQHPRDLKDYMKDGSPRRREEGRTVKGLRTNGWQLPDFHRNHQTTDSRSWVNSKQDNPGEVHAETHN